MGSITIENEKISFENLRDFLKRQKNNAVEEWKKDVFDFLFDWINDDIEYFSIPTSGSTGKSNIIKVKRNDLERSATMTLEYLKIEKGSTALLCLPVKYIGGKMMIVRSFVGNLNLIIQKPSANPLEVQNFYADFLAITPYQLHVILNNEKSKVLLSKTKNVIIGGAAIDQDSRKIISGWKTNIYSTFGMTETLSHIAMSRPIKDGAFIFKLISKNFIISTDERGCLTIKTPFDHAPFLITNDLVKVVSPNEFEWLGRIDNVINSGGIKINPELIEEKIQHILKQNIFIAALPDKKLGEKVCLFIEGKKEISDESLSDLFAAAGLEKNEIPKQIIYLNSFFYTESNKIARTKTIEKLK